MCAGSPRTKSGLSDAIAEYRNSDRPTLVYYLVCFFEFSERVYPLYYTCGSAPVIGAIDCKPIALSRGTKSPSPCSVRQVGSSFFVFEAKMKKTTAFRIPCNDPSQLPHSLLSAAILTISSSSTFTLLKVFGALACPYSRKTCKTYVANYLYQAAPLLHLFSESVTQKTPLSVIPKQPVSLSGIAVRLRLPHAPHKRDSMV